MSRTRRLYYITQDLEHTDHLDMVRDAVKAGVPFIQIRSKSRDIREVTEIARQAVILASDSISRIIVNDRPQVALNSGAHGVHLGRQDMPVNAARSILGPDRIIGGTANTVADVERLAGSGVDYIGLGPYRFTSTKTDLSPVLGIRGAGEVIRYARISIPDLPIYVIGGIQCSDVEEILDLGAAGVAVASAVNRSADRVSALRSFMDAIVNYQEKIEQDQLWKH